MTSHPVVNEGEQKQDISYRDNANSGVIMEENALHRDERSSNTRSRNGTILLSEHARMARFVHDCVLRFTGKVLLCGTDRKHIVECRTASHGCNHRHGRCIEKRSVCSINGEFEKFVTGCECL